MAMEQLLLAKCQDILNVTNSNSNSNSTANNSFNYCLFRQALSLARSLTVNPSTSQQTITSIFETLAPSLQPIPNPVFLHHILSLLSDIATNLPSLSHPIFTAILSFSLNPNNSARTTTDALSVLISIAERDRVLTPAIAQHGEGLFLSLCFRPCVSVRHWLLLNAGRFGIRPSLLLTVFLGFTKDPYPYVRREALVALVGLSKSIVVHDRSVIVACYCRAVELLYDMEDCVRCSAVRACDLVGRLKFPKEHCNDSLGILYCSLGVTLADGSKAYIVIEHSFHVAEWGQLLVASTEESSKKEWSDASFVQICSMVRDMSVGVRVEAFNSLGKVGMVSEKILLQTLSKKVLPSTKEKKYPGQFTAKQCELPASCAAGAFVHGLEDEFHEFKIEDRGAMVIINEIIRNNKYSVKIDFGGVHWLDQGLKQSKPKFCLSKLQQGTVKGVVVFPAGRKGEGWSGVAGELDRLLFALPKYRMYSGMTSNKQEETEQLRERRPCKNTSTSGDKFWSLNNITEVCRSQEQKRKTNQKTPNDEDPRVQRSVEKGEDSAINKALAPQSKVINHNSSTMLVNVDNIFSVLRKDLGDYGQIGLNQFKSPVKLIEGQSKEYSWKPKGFKSGEIRSNISNNLLVYRRKENKEVEVLNYEEETHETSSEGEEEGDTDDSGIEEGMQIEDEAIEEYITEAETENGMRRKGSACCSLRPLAILSVNFSGEALNLMMDVLNDDSLEVRLNALETMHHMATFGCLRVQEAHMHMFLGTLVDTSSLIRSSARKVLKLAKLNKLAMFKLSVDGLIENLEMYPQDEADVFSAIFHIGRSHGKFTVSIVKEVSQDIEPSSEGKLGFDSAKSAALLMLAISAPLSHEQYICSIPPKIFSYAVILLGRISHGLADVMDKNTLLDYLSRCSRSMVISASEFIKGEEPNVDYQHVVHDEAKECAKHIIAQVNCVWPFIQSGCMGEVLRTLRTWKEELATITMDSYQSSDVLVFALQYLRVIKLLGKVWMHFMSRRKLYSNRIGDLGLIFEKLDKNLLEMRYTFIGLSKEEELHIMELILVTCILRLSSGEDSRHKLALKNLCSTISHLEFLHNEGSVEPSIFVNELKKSLPEIDTSLTGPSHSPFLFQKLLKNFTLKQFLFHGEIKHVNALLEVQNNDCENHLPFVSGLPVGIPFNITLYNTSCEERLWLRMSVNKDYNQFVFIDLKLFGGCNSIRKFTFVAPFYKTPKVDSFTLRVCIGMECFYEDVCLLRDFRGPKRELAYLCKEKEVYMSMVVK
ncbi:hypothetical protein LguiB_035450 [Lonicera macranthoides]